MGESGVRESGGESGVRWGGVYTREEEVRRRKRGMRKGAREECKEIDKRHIHPHTCIPSA